MKTCIEIEYDSDTKQFAVEKCEPKEEMAEGEMGGMPQGMDMAQGAEPGAEIGEKAFQSIDEALQAAKQMLLQTPEGMASEQDAQAGFDSVMGKAR